MGVLAIALGAFSSTVVSTQRQRTINRENALASEASRVVIESMHGSDFRLVYALFNADPEDDPGGPGTAPGSSFLVEGLDVGEGEALAVGTIWFPSQEVAEGVWELREDTVNAPMGLPRDLNGDSIVDDADHSDDYLILPVSIEVRWQSLFGPRVLRTRTILTDARL